MQTFVWETREEFKHEMLLQEKAMEQLVKFYVEHSKLNEDDIREMLKRGFWMDAETSVEKGFVDELLA